MAKIAEYSNAVFLAIIGDLKGSRGLPDRAAAQLALERGLAAVNASAADLLASRLVVTIGDEFQGLVRRPGDAMGILADLDGALSGLRIRYGLGLGTLTTPLRPEALRMDGPCFHAARDAVTRARNLDRWAALTGAGETTDAIANGILALMDAVRGRWTARQAEAVAERRRHERMKDAARVMGIKGPTLSKSLKSAHYAAWREGEAALAALLSDPRAAADRAGPTPGKESR